MTAPRNAVFVPLTYVHSEPSETVVIWEGSVDNEAEATVVLVSCRIVGCIGTSSNPDAAAFWISRAFEQSGASIRALASQADVIPPLLDTNFALATADLIEVGHAIALDLSNPLEAHWNVYAELTVLENVV
jgi:hypothetical protein